MDPAAIAERIAVLLRERGWSARELSRRAELGDNAGVSNMLRRMRQGEGVKASTLAKIAEVLGVSAAFLLVGRDDGDSADPPRAEHDTPPTSNLPAGCLGASPTYAPRIRTAKRLAPDVPAADQWVWDDLATVDTLWLGTREPSPQALADLARLIQKHGKPR